MTRTLLPEVLRELKVLSGGLSGASVPEETKEAPAGIIDDIDNLVKELVADKPK